MGDKDIVSKRILKNLVRDFATYLFGLPVVEVEMLDTERQRAEDRRADLVARVAVSGGESFLLHIEVQNDNEATMPFRMLRYLSDILLDSPGAPVRQYLVYIGKERLTMTDGFAMPDFSYRYRIIDMHGVDCHDFLRQDSPDAWVLAILCDFGGQGPRDVIHRILTRLIERLGKNPPRLREYVDMLDILASNRNLNQHISEELKMLTIDVEKLATYQLGIEKGLEKGIEQGFKLGAHDREVAIARELLDRGMEPAWVASVTGLPLPEVKALRNE